MNTFPREWSNIKVILSHDWLTGMRGGERVLEILCSAFPNATVYTLLHDPAAISDTINGHRVITSYLQRIPGILKRYRGFLPLFPAAVRSMKTEPADLLISTSHCVAKGLVPRKGTRHLCYCFTPMRYAWLFYDEYFGSNPVKRLFADPILSRLRAWDKSTSERVDRFVTLSRHVQERIRNYYGRESQIVYPPVNTEFWTPSCRSCAANGKQYDLIVSALVPYKRIDLAVRAYARTGKNLVIAGVGSEFRRLRAMATPNIEFTGWVTDARIRDLYRNCRLLVFPGEEDFGIVPVEAMACGRPVVAYARGGASETIREELTGILFNEQTEDSLIGAVERCAARAWDSSAIRAHAERFGRANFIKGLIPQIEACLAGL